MALSLRHSRPSYHPAALLGLYIYGYLNRVHSSRRLEREAGRNVEVMWLLARLAPDHKTIADFRKDNGPGIKKVCARFVEVCRKMGLLATASVGIDGSKFKAVNNRDKNFTRGKVERRRTQLEESVARYLAQLDTADRQEPSETLELKKTRIKERLKNLTVEMAKLAAIEKQVLASPDQQISFTDPDSRSMATSGQASIVAFCIGAAGFDVTCENVLGALYGEQDTLLWLMGDSPGGPAAPSTRRLSRAPARGRCQFARPRALSHLHRSRGRPAPAPRRPCCRHRGSAAWCKPSSRHRASDIECAFGRSIVSPSAGPPTNSTR